VLESRHWAYAHRYLQALKTKNRKNIKMKLLLTILGLINASYMLIDGIFVMINGKYIGPEKPGPWSFFFEKLNIGVFKLGPMFIIFGILWFVFIYSLQTVQSWTYLFGIVLSIATLWYLPFGTLISIITILSLIIYKSKLGL